MEDNLKEPINQTFSEEEVKALREELALLKKEKEEKEANESLTKKIDELVSQRLNERDNSERKRIEDARRMIEEADRNAALERELMQNEKYNKIDSWRENKIKEFKKAVDVLAQMGRESQHSFNLYRDYPRHQSLAAQGDERARKTLAHINLTYAAMKLGGEKLTSILKRNIGVEE